MVEEKETYEAINFGWDGDDFVTEDVTGKIRRYHGAKITDVKRECSVEVQDGKVIGHFSFQLPKKKG